MIFFLPIDSRWCFLWKCAKWCQKFCIFHHVQSIQNILKRISKPTWKYNFFFTCWLEICRFPHENGGNGAKNFAFFHHVQSIQISPKRILIRCLKKRHFFRTCTQIRPSTGQKMAEMAEMASKMLQYLTGLIRLDFFRNEFWHHVEKTKKNLLVLVCLWH